MAKAKTKRVPYDTTATETAPGVWQWVADGITWEYNPNFPLNTRIIRAGTGVGFVFSEKINDAAIFSQGYGAGFAAGRDANRSDQESQVSKVETHTGKRIRVTQQ